MELGDFNEKKAQVKFFTKSQKRTLMTIEHVRISTMLPQQLDKSISLE